MRAGATSEVSSSWERHPLLMAGLQRLSATALVLLGLLFGADLALSRSGRPEGELSGLVARGAIGLAFAVSLLALVLARRRRRELRRPAALATVVTLLVALAGALETLATGGVHGYFPGGLLVVLLFWPVLMPGGASTAALAVVGSVVLQGAVLIATGDLGLPQVALLSVVLVGMVLGYSQVLERWRRQLSAASRVDWLTGAMSWRALVEDLEVLCARRTRHWAPLTLVMFDVDRFERINDRHGPAFGDDVLELLDSAVRGETRGTDLLGRYRADEFLLVLDACDSQHAVEIIARIRARLASTPLRAGSEEVRITFSAGVVTASPGAPIVAAELLKAAEQALLGSKEAQLNQTNLGGVGPAAAPGLELAEVRGAVAPGRGEPPGAPGPVSSPPEATGPEEPAERGGAPATGRVVAVPGAPGRWASAPDANGQVEPPELDELEARDGEGSAALRGLSASGPEESAAAARDPLGAALAATEANSWSETAEPDPKAIGWLESLVPERSAVVALAPEELEPSTSPTPFPFPPAPAARAPLPGSAQLTAGPTVPASSVAASGPARPGVAVPPTSVPPHAPTVRATPAATLATGSSAPAHTAPAGLTSVAQPSSSAPAPHVGSSPVAPPSSAHANVATGLSAPAQATPAGATAIAGPSSSAQATPAAAAPNAVSSPSTYPARKPSGATTGAVPSPPPLSTRRPASAPSSAPGAGAAATAARGSPAAGTAVASRIGSIAPLVVPALSPVTESSNGIPLVPPVISLSGIAPPAAAAQPQHTPGEPAAEVWRFPPAPPRNPMLAPPPPPDDDFEEAQIIESE